MSTRHPITLSHRLLLLPILLLAALLRFWRLDTLPPGLYHDEAYNGLDALSLTQGQTFPQFYEGWELYAQDAQAERPLPATRWPIFFAGNYGREPLHIYLMALSIKLFGATPFAIRFVPALAGLLGVWTTYLAAAAIFDSRLTIGDLRFSLPAPRSPFADYRLPLTDRYLPLVAALALAIFVPTIHFSRFGLRVMLFIPISTLTVTFFWRGLTAPRGVTASPLRRVTPSFLLAGFFLGLGIYSYAAARLLPLLFVLFVPLWFWRERAALRHYWRPVALMASMALLTAVPLLLFFWRYPYFFVFRIAYVANKGKGTVEGKPWLTWLLNVGRVVRGLFWQGETHLRHNLPGRPFLDPIQAAFFFIGALPTLRRKLDLRLVFLWLWLGVLLLPSILSGDAPHFGRLSGAAPALAIFIALGVTQLAAWLSTHARRPLLIPLFSLLFLLSLFCTARDYFGRYADQPQLAADFYLPDWLLGQYAAAQPADATLYFTPTQEEMATIYFALADSQRLRSYSGGQGLVPAGEEGKAAVYLLRPGAKAALAELQAYFPTGAVQTVRDNFIAFYVPPDAPRLSLAEATAVAFADTITLRGWSLAVNDATLAITLGWQAAAAMATDYTAFVHVLDAAGNLVTQLDRQPNGYPTHDWRPGEMVVDQYVLPLPPDLAAGSYTIETGFYELATLTGLGETAVLTTITVP